MSGGSDLGGARAGSRRGLQQPAPRPSTYVLPPDAHAPRTPEERFRLYVLLGGELRLLATAPDMAGIGVAIQAQHEDQKEVGRRLSDLGHIGILDSVEREWIANPFGRRT